MEMRHSILPSAPHLDFSNTIDSADMFLSLPLRVEELLLFFTASSYAFISSSQIRTQNRSSTSDDCILVHRLCSTYDFLSNIIDLLTGTITRTVLVVRERLHDTTHDSDDQYCC